MKHMNHMKMREGKLKEKKKTPKTLNKSHAFGAK